MFVGSKQIWHNNKTIPKVGHSIMVKDNSTSSYAYLGNQMDFGDYKLSFGSTPDPLTQIGLKIIILCPKIFLTESRLAKVGN